MSRTEKIAFVAVGLIVGLSAVRVSLSEQPELDALRPDLAEIAHDLAKAPPILNYPVRNRPLRNEALERFEKIMRSEFPNNTRFISFRPESFDALRAFYRHQIGKAVDEMRSPEFADGVHFWHIYNCGFVVRDGDTLFAFDLAEPYDLHPAGSFPEWDWLLENLDAAFYSHVHGDHYQKHIADRVAANGHSRVVTWEETSPGPHSLGALRYHTHPGAQATAPNNNYEVVSPSGVVFYHTGDQSFAKDVENTEPQVHVYFGGYGNFDFMMSPRPLAIVPMHMYELHHSGGGRLTRYGPTHHFYDFIEGYDNIMIWGERATVKVGEIPPVEKKPGHGDAVPMPDAIKDEHLRELFRAMPAEYANLTKGLLDNPPVVDPDAPYQADRAKALDYLDYFLTNRAPQVVEAGNSPSAAEFDGIRRFYSFWIAKAVQEIVESPPVDGVKFWHFYRGGWVVKEGDLVFAVNLLFPQYLTPADVPAPREKLLEELTALFVCTGWDEDWAIKHTAQNYPNLTIVDKPAEKTSGEIDGLKWTAYPGLHRLVAPIDVPNTQYIITSPGGVTMYFPGDQTHFESIPHPEEQLDIAFVGFRYFSIIPDHPSALSPVPKIQVPDHLYDLAAHDYIGRLTRRRPAWHKEELDAIWHHQLSWGKSFTYRKK